MVANGIWGEKAKTLRPASPKLLRTGFGELQLMLPAWKRAPTERLTRARSQGEGIAGGSTSPRTRAEKPDFPQAIPPPCHVGSGEMQAQSENRADPVCWGTLAQAHQPSRSTAPVRKLGPGKLQASGKNRGTQTGPGSRLGWRRTAQNVRSPTGALPYLRVGTGRLPNCACSTERVSQTACEARGAEGKGAGETKPRMPPELYNEL